MAKLMQVNNKPKSPPFGVLSLDIARRIDDSDRCAALKAANYRYAAGMRNIEQQFEEEASKLSRAYLDEIERAHGEIEAS